MAFATFPRSSQSPPISAAPEHGEIRERLDDYVNRSHADCREMPSAAPIWAQLTSRDRRISTTNWS